VDLPGRRAIVVVWGISGPVFGFNDTWQLVINTGTIITFLMVFLIQHTQNADTAAMQIKLDELIRATGRGQQRAAGPGRTGRGAAGRDPARVRADGARSRRRAGARARLPCRAARR
jgi:hypothetical protein